MGENILEVAKRKMVAAEAALKKAQEDAESAKHEVDELLAFLNTAERLMPGSGRKQLQKPAALSVNLENGSTKVVKVIKGSLAEHAFNVLVKKTEPILLDELIKEIDLPHEKKQGKDLQVRLYGALWRRKHDLFLKEGKTFGLKTKNIVLVDN